MIDPTTKLLTTQEVADELGLAQSVIEGWIAEPNPELSSFRKGKRIRRVSLADLLEFVLRNRVQARRPEWLTPEVESRFRNLLRESVRLEIQTLNLERAA